MSPTKDEGSSCCKGKKVTVNDPLAKIVGEEASLSESDHFGEEKQGRNLNSEFPPLIDLWYDAHIHFPVVPSDYSLPSPGYMWLSIYRCATKVSWAPLASTIPDFDIRQRTLLPMPNLFKFRSDTSLG